MPAAPPAPPSNQSLRLLCPLYFLHSSVKPKLTPNVDSCVSRIHPTFLCHPKSDDLVSSIFSMFFCQAKIDDSCVSDIPYAVPLSTQVDGTVSVIIISYVPMSDQK